MCYNMLAIITVVISNLQIFDIVNEQLANYITADWSLMWSIFCNYYNTIGTIGGYYIRILLFGKSGCVPVVPWYSIYGK